MREENLKYFKTLGLLQSAISKSETIDEALKQGLKIILDNTGSDYAVMWYENEGVLHPHFWYCPLDLTTMSFKKGQGVVGKSFEEQHFIEIKDFENEADELTKAAFEKLNVSSVLCVPFNDECSHKGCLEFLKVDGQSFSEEEADACQILTMLTEMTIKDNAGTLFKWKEKNVLMNIKGLKKTYINGDFKTQVLKGVDFDVFEGELLCFLGESGCGKSTILNIIGGLDEADEGSFTFNGVDYSKRSKNELTKYRRDNIGYIFQSYNLMPNLNAKQNLDLIAELVDNPMDSIEALKLVGLDSKANSYPSQLSGGQQQRISIARALVKNPKLILADEPTAALDYETSIEVLTSIENVIKSGTTTIMVTHNEEITKMANRVIRFRNGRTYEVTINPNPLKASELVW